jgi:hypothetical protein
VSILFSIFLTVFFSWYPTGTHQISTRYNRIFKNKKTHVAVALLNVQWSWFLGLSLLEGSKLWPQQWLPHLTSPFWTWQDLGATAIPWPPHSDIHQGDSVKWKPVVYTFMPKLSCLSYFCFLWTRFFFYCLCIARKC